MDSGWSIKAMHRLILASAVYQQASSAAEPATAVLGKTAADRENKTSQKNARTADPENKWWSRYSRRRLEAEGIRDSLLMVSGQLDSRMGGAALSGKNREYVTGTGSKLDLALFEKPRRSLYLPVVRSALYDVMQVFDFADPSVLNGHRDQTTVAPQALFMLNSRLMAESCRRLAQQLLQVQGGNDSSRLTQLYQLAYGRSPTEAEATTAANYLDRYERAAPRDGPAPPRQRAWQSLCRAVLAA